MLYEERSPGDYEAVKKGKVLTAIVTGCIDTCSRYDDMCYKQQHPYEKNMAYLNSNTRGLNKKLLP